jgi:hypothetical protein
LDLQNPYISIKYIGKGKPNLSSRLKAQQNGHREPNMDTLCSKCPFFQLAPRIRRKNARKRCRIEPQRTLRIYKCNDFPKKRMFRWK